MQKDETLMLKTREVSQASRLGEPQLITDSVDASRVIDPDDVNARVRECYEEVGFLLNDEEDPALLADLESTDNPLVGLSRGFSELTGFSQDKVLGRNCRMLLQGVPEVAISKSVRKNLRDYCRMCRMRRLHCISEMTSLQPNARHDGSQFVNFFLVGLIEVRQRRFLLGVQRYMGEGLFVAMNRWQAEQVAESTRASFKRIRAKLRSAEPIPARITEGAWEGRPSNAPYFSFFSERLQDHCMLLHGGWTAMRREPQEIATNCLVFGNAPVRKTAEGLYFAIRVNDSVQTFDGLPLMGYTSLKPVDRPELYPAVCRCLGSSVLTGACGEAFARDKLEHFKMGFKSPPQTEVESWSTQPNVPMHKRRSPVPAMPGDIFGCLYTRDGRIQLWRNGTLALDFDVHRPLDEEKDYYAVIDVCLSSYCVSLMPHSKPSESRTEMEVPMSPSSTDTKDWKTEDRWREDRGGEEPSRSVSGLEGADWQTGNIDAIISDLVTKALVRKAIQGVVSCSSFCVTVADPRGKDIPLIAISSAFESMTGFKRSEILGVNCRFLNQGCPISPTDLIGLRIASESGSAFTALLPNRKKSGEMFINLLDLRGLTIANDVETGEELWYLIGIQADVTGLSDWKFPEDHVAELREIASLIRQRLKKDLAVLAGGGADHLERQATCSSSASDRSSQFKLLQEPVWREGALSKKEVLGKICQIDPREASGERKQHEQHSIGILRPHHSPGAFNLGLLVFSAVAFLTGLLLGRGTRR